MTLPNNSARGRHETRTRPPVFFKGATRRLFKQRSLFQGLRAASVISRAVINQAASLMTSGLPYLPRIRQCLKTRSERILLEDNTAVDLYLPEGVSVSKSSPPAIVYVHGGAWGSGESWNFACIASCLSRSLVACPVFLLDYKETQYPSGNMTDQATSVALALKYARSRFHDRPILCIGHSSGAHICALALLDLHKAMSTDPPELLADVFIAQAGVYDIGAHFLHESSRGIALVSPMVHACCEGDEIDPVKMDFHSPLYHLGRRKVSGDQFAPGPFFPKLDGVALEGSLSGHHITSLLSWDKKNDPSSTALGQGGIPTHSDSRAFPTTYVQAAVADLTVPATGSIRFYHALRASGVQASLLLYEGEMGHADFVTDYMSDGVVDREGRCSFLDVHSAEVVGRDRVTKHVFGDGACSIHTNGLDTPGQAAHIRDTVRIIHGLHLET
jgi:acetyl esterase/lipase